MENFQVPNVAPLIIIGMHRSGTSFLSKTLSQCGIFMGADLEGNHESILFMLANNSIFAHCYATWSRPFSVHLALQNESFRNSLARSAFKFVESQSSRYLGQDARKIQGFAGINFPWGWKDPRNTFTLPVWRLVFPGMKVIHILRHGVDVANSLYQRDTIAYQKTQRAYWPALGVVRDGLGLFHARPCFSIEQAFLIWEEYAEKAVQQVEALGNNALQLKYEDLLHDPQSKLQKILEFCGLEADSIPPGLLDSVNADRAYSYRKNPELVEFADSWKETLARYDY